LAVYWAYLHPGERKVEDTNLIQRIEVGECLNEREGKYRETHGASGF
jgi:hypothetical protein